MRRTAAFMRVALPGVDPKDVEVTVSDDYLVIRGERKGREKGVAGTCASSRTARSASALPEGIDQAR
jgi:HSP20 family molecular chaperone IbpA